MKKKSTNRFFGILAVSTGLTILPAAAISWDGTPPTWTSTQLGGQTWTDYAQATFSTAGTHNIAVGPGVLVGKPTAANAVALAITAGNYTFSGESLTFRNANAAGSGDMDIQIANNSTVTFNNRVINTNTGGNFRFQPSGNAVVNFNGGLTSSTQTSLGNFQGTINFNVGGTSNVTSTVGQLIISSNVNVGNSTINASNLLFYKNFFTVNDASAVVNLSSTAVNSIQSGQSNENGTGVRIQAGDVNLAGGIVITSANRNAADTGNKAGGGLLEVSGGTLDVAGDIALTSATKANAIGNGAYVQTGGVVTTRGIISGTAGANAADGAGSVGSINVSGGELYVGATGINRTATGPTVVTMAFSGGTIGATANYSSNLDMTLSNTVTFKAADAADAAHDITLDGELSGDGTLIKSGDGTLTFNTTNTYTGNISVTDGTMVLGQTGALTFEIGANGINNSISGTGDVDLNGTFIFDLALAAASGTWDIVDVDTLAESYGANFQVAGFTETATDIWTFNNGNATYTYNQATGQLTALAIPEPSSLALVGAGLIGLAARRTRRKN